MCLVCEKTKKELEDITYLKCINCEKVTEIPKLYNLQYIKCINCPNLKKIYFTSTLLEIAISKCPNITLCDFPNKKYNL